jgi:alginate O-acetyltransferase complex protein AlgI
MITMLLGGLWHGANWTFVIWGGLHGTYLMINHGLRRIMPAFLQQQPIYRLFGWGLTFVAVVTAWVFFRANTFAEAWGIVHSMFVWQAAPQKSLISHYDFFILAMAYAIALVLPNVHQCFAQIKLTLDGDSIRAQTRNLFSGGNVVIDKLSQALLWKPS